MDLARPCSGTRTLQRSRRILALLRVYLLDLLRCCDWCSWTVDCGVKLYLFLLFEKKFGLKANTSPVLARASDILCWVRVSRRIVNESWCLGPDTYVSSSGPDRVGRWAVLLKRVVATYMYSSNIHTHTHTHAYTHRSPQLNCKILTTLLPRRESCHWRAKVGLPHTTQESKHIMTPLTFWLGSAFRGTAQ